MPLLIPDDLSALCIAALEKHGAPSEHAAVVAEALIANEKDGYASHGVLRIAEYVHFIGKGTLDPRAVPSVHRKGQGWIVDAHNGFGYLATRKISETVCSDLQKNGMTVVGLRNSGHVGRLAGLGRSLALAGHVVFGFCNSRGACKRVAPCGAQQPLLPTNPLLFACPRGDDGTFVLDMSTSVVAEGKIRAFWLKNQRLPTDRWLYDLHGNPTDDPTGLYAMPPEAVMAPLGGDDAGHKGFGLGIMVEILAGILIGGEFSSQSDGPGGNGASFIALRPDCLGVPQKDFRDRVDQLARYCETSRRTEGFAPLRMPGDGSSAMDGDRIDIPQPIYDQLVAFSA